MSRRSIACVVAFVTMVGLWVAALVIPVPYVTFSPGVTVDVLAERKGEEIIDVSGHRVYRDDGELRMTTVSVTSPDGELNILEALGAWMDEDTAIYPREVVYPPEKSVEESQTESAVEMLSSQDTAVAVALKQLGYTLRPEVKIVYVVPKLPGEGKLKAGDHVETIDGKPMRTVEDVNSAMDKVREGVPVTYVVRREGERLTETVTPRTVDGDVRVGVVAGAGYRFPVQVKVNLPEEIGGPSAGLMFTLGIYDTLTPGSLTDGKSIAGTGTIDIDGKVGPIGGVQQKIVGAAEAGSKLFLVPAGDCADALRAPARDITLVKVDTMDSALRSIKQWTEDPEADLPSCQESSNG